MSEADKEKARKLVPVVMAVAGLCLATVAVLMLLRP